MTLLIFWLGVAILITLVTLLHMDTTEWDEAAEIAVLSLVWPVLGVLGIIVCLYFLALWLLGTFFLVVSRGIRRMAGRTAQNEAPHW